MSFILDPKLNADTTLVCYLPLSQVRLHNNSDFPWIMLVPQLTDVKELIDLSESDQAQLFKEIMQASRVMKELFNPDKLNVANLGNIVAQLHIHVIARFQNDKAWPHPVWNSGHNSDYLEIEKQQMIIDLKNKFKELDY